MGNGENCTIESRERIIFGEKNMCAGSAVGISFVGKACIGVSTKNHVTRTIHYSVIRISGNIVKEEMYRVLGGYGGLGLPGRDGT